MIHRLERELVVPAEIDDAWEFIRRPANLDRITPPDLRFQIVGEVPDAMYDGLLVEYRVRIPWLGTRRWLSEIKHVRAPYAFVDEQRVGPYRLWYHEHELAAVPGGVRFRDRVHYALPLWPLGELAHRLLVRRTLERIFDYRAQRLRERFATPAGARRAAAPVHASGRG